MGLEAVCKARLNGKVGQAKVHLDSAELQLRGDFKLSIPFSAVQELAADDQALSLEFPDGKLRLELGAASRKWMDKIRNPPTLLSKLGIKPGTRVAVEGVSDEKFLAELEKAGVESNTHDADVLIAGIESVPALNCISVLRKHMHPSAALWIVYPKGQKHITQSDVMAATKAAGLVDTKVAAFSATHTALKAVIPVAKRKSAAPA